MKKITILIDDDVDLTSLFTALVQAKEIKMETVEGEKKPVRRRTGRMGVQTIMSHYTPEGVFSFESARTWVEKEGYAGSSTSPFLSRLVTAGFLQRTDDGRFRFVKPFDPKTYKESK